jgi:hypothetical protein
MPSVSRLFGECGSLNVSQPYGPPRAPTGIALLLSFFIYLLLMDQNVIHWNVSSQLSVRCSVFEAQDVGNTRLTVFSPSRLAVNSVA